MTNIPYKILDELLLAMEIYNKNARHLIDKLIIETNQPQKTEIVLGNYCYIQNAELFNGREHLSDDWSFNVHGEHCLFENIDTGQRLEVSLVDKSSVDNLDPYFFYNFLETTESLKHLTKYLGHPFNGTFELFKDLERQKILTHISGAEFRKSKSDG